VYLLRKGLGREDESFDCCHGLLRWGAKGFVGNMLEIDDEVN